MQFHPMGFHRLEILFYFFLGRKIVTFAPGLFHPRSIIKIKIQFMMQLVKCYRSNSRECMLLKVVDACNGIIKSEQLNLDASIPHIDVANAHKNRSGTAHIIFILLLGGF